MPEQVNAWLATGTSYTSGDPGGNDRRVRSGFQGDEILPIIPPPGDPAMDTSAEITEPSDPIASGALAMLRIDGKGRGVASGLGIALSATDHVEFELAVLRSDQWGAYAGMRYRLLAGMFRPYVAAGLPLFAYDDDRDPTDPTKLAVGLRGAGGLEVRLNGHLSLQGDLGYEHFFHLSGTSFDADLIVPTLALIGRL